jgi:hypothetical protein
MANCFHPARGHKACLRAQPWENLYARATHKNAQHAEVEFYALILRVDDLPLNAHNLKFL